jgi:hypothetical protein
MGFLDKFISKEAQEKIKATVKSAAEVAEEKLKEAAEFAEEKKKESSSSQSAYSPAQVAANNDEEYSVTSNAPHLIKKHKELIIPYTAAVGSDVSKNDAAAYIADLIIKNLPGVEIKKNVNISAANAEPGKKYVPVDLVLIKDSKPVLAVIVCGKNKYRLYGVINTMNACEEKGLPAIRFFKEFENKPEYVIGRIKAVAGI